VSRRAIDGRERGRRRRRPPAAEAASASPSRPSTTRDAFTRRASEVDSGRTRAATSSPRPAGRPGGDRPCSRTRPSVPRARASVTDRAPAVSDRPCPEPPDSLDGGKRRGLPFRRPRRHGEVAMAKKSYYLDTRVLTAFFFAAMPFRRVRLVHRRQPGPQPPARVGRAQPRAAGRPDEAGPRAVRRRADRPPAPAGAGARAAGGAGRAGPARARGRPASARAGLAGGKDAKLNASVLETPLATRLKLLPAVRPSFKLVQLVDSSGRVLAASTRAGASSRARAPGSRSSRPRRARPRPTWATCSGARAPRRTCSRSPTPSAARRRSSWGRSASCSTRRALHRARPGPHREDRPRLAAALDRRHGPRLGRERADHEMPMPGWESLRNAVEGFPLGESGQQIFARSGSRRGYWTMPEVRSRDEAAATSSSSRPASSASRPSTRSPTSSGCDGRAGPLGGLSPVDSVTRYLWIHFIGSSPP